MNRALRDNIDWVGYVDWTVRDFHGYDTARGSTYNAYLIRDEKTALIDTVKAPYAEHLIGAFKALVDPLEINYVVCNHAEPDHAGALGRVLGVAANAVLICDQKCREALSLHQDISSWRIRTVATGDEITLGKRTMRFIETPMLHWPESMFTYVPEERLLFSMDAFGQHYATSERFDDEGHLPEIMQEATTYYANILMPYGKLVTRLLHDVSEMQIDMIAPSHGIIWRRHASDIMEAYRNWAAGRSRQKVLVVYDTMWGSTETMARAIIEGASSTGVECRLIHVRHSNLTRIATEVLDSAVVAFGSSTLNAGMMPVMAAVLTYLAGLRPARKGGMAFGSYGWGRGGPEEIDKWLEKMKFEKLHEPLKVRYRPTEQALDECRTAGIMLGEKARRPVE